MKIWTGNTGKYTENILKEITKIKILIQSRVLHLALKSKSFSLVELFESITSVYWPLDMIYSFCLIDGLLLSFSLKCLHHFVSKSHPYVLTVCLVVCVVVTCVHFIVFVPMDIRKDFTFNKLTSSRLERVPVRNGRLLVSQYFFPRTLFNYKRG